MLETFLFIAGWLAIGFSILTVVVAFDKKEPTVKEDQAGLAFIWL